MVVVPGVVAIVDVAAVQEGIVLAVGHDDFLQLLSLDHCGFHQLPALDAPAVVGKGHHIGRHALQVCQLFALFTHGDGAVGEDADHAVLPNDVQLLL